MTSAHGHDLTTCEIITSPGYGRGLPVLLPWGLGVVREMVSLLERCLTSPTLGDVRRWAPSLLVDAETYDLDVGAVGGYDNVFRLRRGPQRAVLRADAAVDGLRHALALRTANGPSSVLAAYTAVRALGGACPPLVRDRAIFPVMQFNGIVAAHSAAAAHTVIVDGVDAFMQALGLPTCVVDMGEWKRYARRRIDWVLADLRLEPTVLAMAYTVGDHYRERVGVPADAEAFDVGLTAKPLAVLARLAPTDDRFVLPSAIAPVQVVVGSVGTPPVGLASGDVRVKQVDASSRGWWSPWFRRGVPVIVENRSGECRRRVGNSGWEPHDPDAPMHLLVAAADAQRFASPVSVAPHDDVPGFEVLCDDCAASYRLAAPVLPSEPRTCTRCGRGSSMLRFVAQSDQVY